MEPQRPTVRQYNKLVRDRILEIIEQRGGTSTHHIAGDEEYWNKLKEKLQEEVNEFLESEEPSEIADILEVLDAICAYKGIDKSELGVIKDKKARERGGFDRRIILEEA